MTKSLLLVDIPKKPILIDEKIYSAQRYHVLPLELSTETHAFLVRLFIPQLSKILNQRNKDVFGVVFLKLCLVGLICRHRRLLNSVTGRLAERVVLRWGRSCRVGFGIGHLLFHSNIKIVC